MESRARSCVFAAAALFLHVVLGFAGHGLEGARDGHAAASPAPLHRGAPAIKPDAGGERQLAIELPLFALPPSREIPARLAGELVDLCEGGCSLRLRETRSNAARAPPVLST
jgi:hypothetical protein